VNDTDTAAEQLRSSSTLTFARSVFHAAEAKELFEHELAFASAVSAYYSIFHLGAALVLVYCSRQSLAGDPHASLRRKLEEKWAKRQMRTLCNGEPYLSDPAGDIGHDDVAIFLERESPEIFSALGRRDRPGTLRDMREFVSYAPRMVNDGRVNFLYSGCQYEPQVFRSGLERHLNRIFFCNAAAWIKPGCIEVHSRLLSGDFVLFEFAELRSYHPQSVARRAFGIYRFLCEEAGLDWRVYRRDPETWRTDEAWQHQRYAEVIQSLT
jgi:hypothetical protein